MSSKVCFALVALVCLQPSSATTGGTNGAPSAPHGCGRGCRLGSLEQLLDRVLQQSSRMHSVSSDLHSEFERYQLPSRNLIGKRRCHTSSILTPEDKSNAQKLGRERLIEVILKLLAAWGDPLSQLHWSLNQDQEQDQEQDLSHHRTNKVLEISDMVRELSAGVAIMVKKMKLLGVLGNAVELAPPPPPPESLAPAPPSSTLALDRRREAEPLDRHDLLYCLRRDSNKVKNYLRVLKCATFPGPDC